MTTSLAIIAAVLAACDAPPPPAPPQPPPAHDPWVVPPTVPEVMATLQRTGCLGVCPIYKLTIYRDGRVEYDGEHYVKVHGRVVTYVPTRELRSLDDEFERAHYLDLDDSYTHYDATDDPSQITSYRLNGRTKTITHYGGDSHAPRQLTDVEGWIDVVVDSDRWVGTSDEREAHARDWY